jgi:hypothetical protein
MTHMDIPVINARTPGVSGIGIWGIFIGRPPLRPLQGGVSVEDTYE